MPGQILRVDHPDGDAVAVHDDEVVDAVLFEEAQDFADEFAAMDALRLASHVASDRLVPDPGAARLEGAGEVALGEDPGEGSVLRHDDDGTGAGLGHAGDDLADGEGGRDRHEIGPAAHDVPGPEEQGAAERSAGVQLGEMLLGEAARLQQDHGEGIAHDEGVRGAGGGGEVEGAGLAADVDVEDAVGGLAEGRGGLTGDRDDPGAAAFQVREQGEELGGLAGVAEGDDAVARVDEAEVAVDGVLAVQDGGGRSGRVQGGGELAADVAGFPDPDDEDLRPALDRGFQDLHGGGEGGVEALKEALQLLDFEGDDAPGLFERVHAEMRRGEDKADRAGFKAGAMAFRSALISPWQSGRSGSRVGFAPLLMPMKPPFRSFAASVALSAAMVSLCAADSPGLHLPGGNGPGKGKKIVFLAGDEEYRSEEALPMLAKILSRRHGFDATVLFSIDPEKGHIDPNQQKNIPGTEALAEADLLVVFTRFRDLPPEQTAPITAFLNAGKPVIGLRTATHAFAGKMEDGGWTYGDWSKGGFGLKILGETWVAHHGAHKKEGARGVIEEANASHPVLRGVEDVFAASDVYTVKNLTGDETVLLRGIVTETLDPASKPIEGEKNDPLQALAWLREYTAPNGTTKGQAFCTTAGAAVDLVSEDLRRLIVNAALHLTGLEVPEKADVSYVDPFYPSFYGFIKDETFWPGRNLKPADFGFGKAPVAVDPPGSPEWPFRKKGPKG